MTHAEEEAQLARMAARAEARPFFVASALAAYRQLAGLDDAGLAARLGLEEAALPRLALCRRPRGEDVMFRSEVDQIATHTGCDPVQLANLLRAADAAERMSTAAPGALLAARDRTPDPAAPEDESDANETSAAEGESEPLQDGAQRDA